VGAATAAGEGGVSWRLSHEQRFWFGPHIIDAPDFQASKWTPFAHYDARQDGVAVDVEFAADQPLAHSYRLRITDGKRHAIIGTGAGRCFDDFKWNAFEYTIEMLTALLATAFAEGMLAFGARRRAEREAAAGPAAGSV
jgi:hypothetical protein